MAVPDVAESLVSATMPRNLKANLAMRYSLLACLVLASLVGSTEAQSPKLKITGVRVGFRGAENRPQRCKTGLWTPVYVDVENLETPVSDYELEVKTTDSDDVENLYVERRFLPPLEAPESRTLLTYARPGNGNSDITVRLRRRSDVNHTFDFRKVERGLNFDTLSPSCYVYLALGNPLPGLRRNLVARTSAMASRGMPGLNQPPEGEDQEMEVEENGSRRFTHAETIEQLPTNWFGYQVADTILLTTSNEQLVKDLNRDNDDLTTARLKALAEWVRRGGQLVISVAHNHQIVKDLLGKMELINLAVKGQVPQVPRLFGVEQWAESRGDAFRGRPSAQHPGEFPNIEVALLVPGPGVQVLATDTADAHDRNAHPTIVQAPCGLGRVIVLAFDVDQPPFTTWGGQKHFWEKLAAQVEAQTKASPNPNQPMMSYYSGQEKELASFLQDSLEVFPDVPVISFGWVALFILVYIVIVGPLDYFFLKMVVKRLELTWITFPTVVIVISAAAYFAAYYLKGHDLRINKIDVIDIDLHKPHVYGTTWFTLFSPRIQNYTVGIEPNRPSWGEEPKAGSGSFSPLVGWMGRPEELYAGMGRGPGSGGLFRRAYDYAPEATGLERVPIQVWSTKSFEATWHRPLGEKDLFEADLKFTRADANKVGGTITNRLPVQLKDVILFYKGLAFNLDSMAPLEEIRLDPKNIGSALAGGVDLRDWYSRSFSPEALQAKGSPRRGQASQPPGRFLKSILFFGHTADNQASQNTALHFLDQHWRLSRENKGEAILVARAVPPADEAGEGPAEEISQGAISPTRLWLGALPGSGARPSLDGTLAQETYIRVFIPIR